MDKTQITLSSDLRVSFDQLGLKFQSMLQERQHLLDTIMSQAIESFDFETLLTKHIHWLLETGLEAACEEIDITPTMKALIWKKITEQLQERGL